MSRQTHPEQALPISTRLKFETPELISERSKGHPLRLCAEGGVTSLKNCPRHIRFSHAINKEYGHHFDDPKRGKFSHSLPPDVIQKCTKQFKRPDLSENGKRPV